MAPRSYPAARLLGVTVVTAGAVAGGVLLGHYAWGKESKAPSRSGENAQGSTPRPLAAATAGGGGNLMVHGGFNLTRQKLAALLKAAPTIAGPGPLAEDPCRDTTSDNPLCRPERSAQANALPVISTPNVRETAKGLPDTPAPTKSWKATFSSKAGFPADAQIAVSSTHVIVSNRQQMQYFDKNGNAVGGVVGSASFFAPLNLKDAAGNSINRFNDIRLVFDEFRKRFWMTTYAYTATQNVPLDKQRYFLPMAVSKTENPVDGWYLYWWDGASQQGNASSSIWKPGDAPDYPVIGIDPTAVTITHSVNNNGFKYWRVTLTPAGPLANGQAVGGWQFWDLKNPDGSKPNLIAPAVHHGSPAGGWAYWAGRQGADSLVVWRIKDPFGPNRAVERTAVKLQTWSNPVNATQKGSNDLIKMTNLGTSPLKAVYRNGNLYTATNDARDWGGIGVVRTSLRFIRLPLGSFPNIPSPPNGGGVDRIFGGGNPNEEIQGNKYYAWPGLDVNKKGDTILGYVRTGDNIYPEVRASAYLAAENDIRPSRQLKAGDTFHANASTSSPLPWGDTAGSGVDPSDDTSIWVAQEYASSTANNNGNYDIWVGKFFGE